MWAPGPVSSACCATAFVSLASLRVWRTLPASPTALHYAARPAASTADRHAQGVDPHRLALLRYVLKACRAEARVGDLFSDRSMSSRFASLAKQHLKVGGWAAGRLLAGGLARGGRGTACRWHFACGRPSGIRLAGNHSGQRSLDPSNTAQLYCIQPYQLHPLQGVENVYTQHTPPLVGLLERLVRGRLPEVDYPRAERNASPQAPKVGVRSWTAVPAAAAYGDGHASRPLFAWYRLRCRLTDQQTVLPPLPYPATCTLCLPGLPCSPRAWWSPLSSAARRTRRQRRWRS